MDSNTVNLGNISLNTELTLQTLPAGFAEAEQIRAIVWYPDPDYGPNQLRVHDIAEGTPAWIVEFFNKKRKWWLYLGCDPTARLEIANNG